MRRYWRSICVCGVSGLFLATLAACNTCKNPASTMASMKPEGKLVTVANPIPGEFIVVLKSQATGSEGVRATAASAAASLTAKYGGQSFLVYEHALRGFAAKLTTEQALALSADPEVDYVQQNGVFTVSESQPDATWGLDRVDQQSLPLNKTYVYNATGADVHAYVIDTGIRISHEEFEARGEHSFDSIDDGRNGNDCNGHGTHVAGTIGGKTYGVAKNVKLHAVRVLDCRGSGSTASVVAGVDWVTNNRQLPAVANMSLGGGVDRALDDAVRRSVAAGVVYALAAGNENQDACLVSPARTPEAITVGATTNGDQRSSFSNYGSCVDIFAPGSAITSAWSGNDKETNTISGTSMATPHVAGVVALYLERNPKATPADVATALSDNSTADKVFNPGACSPNRLLYSGFIGTGDGKPAVSQARHGGPTLARAGRRSGAGCYE